MLQVTIIWEKIRISKTYLSKAHFDPIPFHAKYPLQEKYPNTGQKKLRIWTLNAMSLFIPPQNMRKFLFLRKG